MYLFSFKNYLSLEESKHSSWVTHETTRHKMNINKSSKLKNTVYIFHCFKSRFFETKRVRTEESLGRRKSPAERRRYCARLEKTELWAYVCALKLRSFFVLKQSHSYHCHRSVYDGGNTMTPYTSTLIRTKERTKQNREELNVYLRLPGLVNY